MLLRHRFRCLCFAFLLSSCSPAPFVHIDWLDLIRLNGVTYYSEYPFVSNDQSDTEIRDIYPDDELSEFERIENFVPSQQPNLNYRIKDGDSTRLDVGTPVYSISSYDPTFRLIVKYGHDYVLYEVGENVNAEIGADLLDIENKVIRIDLEYGNQHENKVLVTDSAEIESLVSAVLVAPVTSDVPLCDEFVFVHFALQDLTSTTQHFCSLTNKFRSGIQISQSAVETLQNQMEE